MRNPYAAEPESQIGTSLRKIWWPSPHSQRYLAVLCIVVVVLSAISHRAELLGLPGPPLVTLLRLVNGLVMVMWMRSDARLRGSPISGGGLLAAAILVPIAVPSYILWTRRWWGLVAIILSLIAMLAATIVGESAVKLALGVPIVVT